MNKDYDYCVGPNYFGGPALCQSCKQHIPFCTEVKETRTWTMPMYDEKTGTCPLHEPKTENSNEREKVTQEKVRILKMLGFDIDAPTIYDAAKFLREEWGADLVVSPKFNSKTGDRIGYFWRWPQRTDVIDNKTYRTFEGALSAGISAILEPFKDYYNGNR